MKRGGSFVCCNRARAKHRALYTTQVIWEGAGAIFYDVIENNGGRYWD